MDSLPTPSADLNPPEQTASYLALWHCPSRIVLVEGPAGTGKTVAILAQLCRRARVCAGMRVMLARSTRTRLTQSVLVTLEQQVFPDVLGYVPGKRSRSGRQEYELHNGSVIVPVGLDDPERSFSSEWSMVYVNEVTELDNDEKVLLLLRGLRQAGPYKRQLILDCNPGAPGHWANRCAEPGTFGAVETWADYVRLQQHNSAEPPAGKWKRIITRHQDNVAYFDQRSWAYTMPGRRYLDEQLSGFTSNPHLYRRMVQGIWSAGSGVVFPEFDRARHVVADFPVPDFCPQWVGIDPGYDHPCAILWLALSPNGTLYVCHERYQSGKGIAYWADEVKRINAGRDIRAVYADPQHAFSRTAQSVATIAQQFAAAGVRVWPWPRTTDSAGMVERVRSYLVEGKLKVFASCVDTINEFETWSYKRLASGQMPAGDDQFEDRANHALDVVKGLLACPLLRRRVEARSVDPDDTPKPMNGDRVRVLTSGE